MRTSNPYIFTDSVQPEMFFGRQEEISNLINHLTGMPGESIALIGGRRMGKTSLLKMLWQWLEIRMNEPASDPLPLPFLWDFHGANINSVYDFFRILTKAVQKKLNNLLGKSLTNTPIFAKELPPPIAFQQIMEEWEKILVDQRGCRLRFILLLDECEQIIGKPWVPELYSALRFLLQEHTTPPLLKIVMAGSHRFLSRVREDGSPLRNVLTDPITLSVLDMQSTYDLITQPTKNVLSNEVVQTVVRQSGGHPFLTQYIMHGLWNYGLDRVTTETVQNVTSQFFRKRSDFQDWADDIGASGLKVYEVLSRTNDTLTESQIRANFHPIPPDTPQTLETLCYHGLIVRELDGQKYRVAGQMFQEWFDANIQHTNTTFNDPVTNKSVIFTYNRILLALCVTVFLVLVLQIFLPIAEPVLVIIGIMFGLITYLFPDVLQIPKKIWFQKIWMTVLMVILIVVGAGTILYFSLLPSLDTLRVTRLDTRDANQKCDAYCTVIIERQNTELKAGQLLAVYGPQARLTEGTWSEVPIAIVRVLSVEEQIALAQVIMVHELSSTDTSKQLTSGLKVSSNFEFMIDFLVPAFGDGVYQNGTIYLRPGVNAKIGGSFGRFEASNPRSAHC
jgi:hypothetical protein